MPNLPERRLSLVSHEPEEALQAPEDLAEFLLSTNVNLLGERGSGQYIGEVPIDVVDYEEVPVREDWAGDLAVQMQETAKRETGTGQQEPIQLGWVRGESKLRIIDGFHREAAVRRNGSPSVFAVVKEIDINTLYDERIFNAKNHVYVRFSRVVHWMKEVWEHSGLSDKLTLSQAANLQTFNTSGARLGLAAEDVDAAKAWIKRKSELWQLHPMTIKDHLEIADTVAMDLVLATREKISSHKLEAPTQAILKVFKNSLPHQHELQRVVMETAIVNNLTGPQVKAVCTKVKSCTDRESAQAIIDEIDWDVWNAEYSSETERKLRRRHDARFQGARILAPALEAIERGNTRAQQSLDREEEVTPAMAENLRATDRLAARLVNDLGELRTRFGVLLGETDTDLATSERASETLTTASTSSMVGDYRGGFSASEKDSVERSAVEMQLFVSELELVRGVLENRVLKREYLPPPLPSRTDDIRKISVATHDHAAVLAATKPRITEAHLAVFDRRTTTIKSTLVQHLAGSNNITEATAAAVFDDSIARLRQDITTGALRYAELAGPQKEQWIAAFDQLISATIKDELQHGRKRRRQQQLDEQEDRTRLTPGELDVSLDAMVSGVSSMTNPNTRRALLLHTFFDASRVAIQQILRLDSQSAEQAVMHGSEKLHPIPAEII